MILSESKLLSSFYIPHPLWCSLTIKVAYPQLQPEGPSSEALLKSLWRHACNYYFKPIEDGELRRLHYLKTAIQPNVEGSTDSKLGDYRFQ